MKKIKVLFLMSIMILSTGILFAQNKSDKKLIGTWTFSAPEAPYEYSTGDLVITKEEKELKGELVFSEYYKLKVHDLKLEDNIFSFKAYVEGEVIYAKNTITKDEMKGKVSYSEGTLEFSAKKKKK
jgi:hypothetical protein